MNYLKEDALAFYLSAFSNILIFTQILKYLAAICPAPRQTIHTNPVYKVNSVSKFSAGPGHNAPNPQPIPNKIEPRKS